MNAQTLIIGITQLVTAIGPAARHGASMRDLVSVEDAAIAISEGRFLWIGPRRQWHGHADALVDLGGVAVVPGLVDPHTHAVWAGDRLADFALRTSGAPYEQILAAGRGIRSSIRATQNTCTEDLVTLAIPRLRSLVHSGATVIEVKSGYGFTPEHEIRSLQAIHRLQSRTPARIIPTLLIHIPPTDASRRVDYLHQVTTELIPEVARRHLATSVDIFVERDAWHPAEAEAVLRCAQSHRLALKMHTEQFHAIGGLELALQLGLLSVDHLEAATPDQFPRLASSATIATLLPGVSLHLGIPNANGRALIDAGAAVAIGTDLNPGSSPLFSTSAALALAVRLNGLSAEEALVAGTINAAAALGLDDAGRIEPGLNADFAVLSGKDWRHLVYTLGINPVREVWIAGQRIGSEAPQ
jgi:imidazolonepropionase